MELIDSGSAKYTLEMQYIHPLAEDGFSKKFMEAAYKSDLLMIKRPELRLWASSVVENDGGYLYVLKQHELVQGAFIIDKNKRKLLDIIWADDFGIYESPESKSVMTACVTRSLSVMNIKSA